MTHHCGKCPSRWGGYNTAHCGACHETFTGITAFDKHRAGSHAQGTRHCVPPQEVGLIPSDRTYLCWGLEGSKPPIVQISEPLSGSARIDDTGEALSGLLSQANSERELVHV